eukprot:403362137
MNHNLDDSEDGSQAELLTKGVKPAKPINDSKLQPTDEQKAKKKKIIKWSIIIAIILIIVALAIALPLALRKSEPDTPTGYNPYHADIKDVVNDQSSVNGVIRAPASYNQKLHQVALDRVLPEKLKDGQPTKLGVSSESIPRGANNKFIQNLKFSFDMQSYRVARLSLTDNDNKRFSIPESAVPKPGNDLSMRLEMLGFTYSLNPFSFTFTDVIDQNNVYLTTKGQTLVMTDKFIQVDFLLPSQRIFGFGERAHNFMLSEGTYTMWATGQDQKIDDGLGRLGTYGVHPFVLVQGKNKDDFFGIYFRNSNAQSPVIKYTDNGQAILSYIAIGGNIEAYFFIHGSAKDIIQQYHNTIGSRINLPPFWALGWQQASQKYNTQQKVLDAINGYKGMGMPLETIYLDLSYLKSDSNFQIDTTAFTNLQDLATTLHANNQRLVVMIKPTIVAEDLKDSYFVQGQNDNIFLKSSIHKNKDYQGALINTDSNGKKVVFIDWFNNKCIDMWKSGIEQIYSKVPFDGIWLDMNEPFTNENGEVNMDPVPPTPTETEQRFLLGDQQNGNTNWYGSYANQDEETSNTFKLPFIPRYFFETNSQDNSYGNFDMSTVSLNGTHADGESEFNLHNLYGHMQAQWTQAVLNDDKSPLKDNRKFVVSRSTFPSSGRFASHSSGQNPRSWDFLKQSIHQMMSMNMFGITHTGSEICGYKGNVKDEEMCARWVQLATFYPLARFNQNDKDGDSTDVPNEPFYLNGDYLTMALNSMTNRYQYLRHMYTCLFEVSQWGGSCIDPLLYYYPEDDNVYDDIGATFMVGGSIKVSPVLDPIGGKQKTFKSYFPAGQWVNLDNYADIIGTNDKGGYYDLDAQSVVVNKHLAPGSMIPWQDSKITKAMTTADLLKFPISLIANRDQNQYAYGTLFLDQGQTESEINNNQYEYYQINFQAKSIQMFFGAGTRGSQNQLVDQVLIVNADDLSNVKQACYYDHSQAIQSMDVKYLDDQKTLRISVKEKQKVKFSDIQAIHYAADGDLNLCDPLASQYQTKDGQLPDITNLTTASIELVHIQGTLPNIQVDLRVILGTMVNVKWTWKMDEKGQPPAGKRIPVEVPEQFINSNFDSVNLNLSKFITLQDKPFQINVKYRSDNEESNVFQIQGMIYDEYLNWIQATVNTMQGEDFKGIFGLGERANKDFFFKDGVYSMHSRDQPTPDEDGQSPGKNMYGVHPFFMYKHKPQAWVGILYKLGNSQDWFIKNNQDQGQIFLNTIATGGVVDIYVMQGTTPDQVVQNYHKLIGTPVLIPQWALGWSQSKWGYSDTYKLRDVVQQYRANDLPLDVQWSDIDYLRTYRDFEYDYERFWDLPQFIDELHDMNMKYVPIIDAGIAYRTHGNYSSFEDGLADDVFMKINDENFIGQVWPNDAVYPDYYNPKTTPWWNRQLSYLWSSIKFDGLWQDMNEASNFCFGACYDRQQAQSPVKHKLKYTPTQRNLDHKSMSMDATHSNGYQQIDTHNYYGTQMVKATDKWFADQDMRTFIIERSSFAGMGKYGSRWLGDNFSDAKSMGYSVSGIMLMNIFGIPLVGSDICGFIGDTSPELCARWHVVGSFYPFSRNHNNNGNIDQEPYRFKGLEYEPGVQYFDIMKNAIKNKYQLIRYYYSSLVQLSLKGSGTFYKPLFFEFPEDPYVYQDVIYNIMLGNSLKLSVNTNTLNQNSTNYQFPPGLWCNLYQSAKYPCFTSTIGQQIYLPSKAYDAHVHIRQGSIVPLQNATEIKFSTTYDLQQQPVDFHILGEPTSKTSTNFRALGDYYNDDGLTRNLTNKLNSYQIVAQQTNNQLSMQIIWVDQATNYTQNGCSAVNMNDYISKIFFYNAKGFQINYKYLVLGTQYPSSKQQFLGYANYEADTDRLVVKAQDPVCMTKYYKIDFQKLA